MKGTIEEKDTVEQLWANYRKALTAQIRLKYSLMADNEINRRLPAEQKKFLKAVQQGVFPAPPDLSGAIGE